MLTALRLQYLVKRAIIQTEAYLAKASESSAKNAYEKQKAMKYSDHWQLLLFHTGFTVCQYTGHTHTTPYIYRCIHLLYIVYNKKNSLKCASLRVSYTINVRNKTQMWELIALDARSVKGSRHFLIEFVRRS